jgi:hypothetical protein
VRPYLKNNQLKRAGRVAQAVEHLASKGKALSSKKQNKTYFGNWRYSLVVEHLSSMHKALV